MPNLQNLFKAIPSTDKCLDALARAAGNGCSPDAVRLLAESPRPLIREAVSAYWDRRRDDVRGGKITEPGELSLDTRFDDMLSFVKRMAAPRMQPVINGTGVIIHTNTAVPSWPALPATPSPWPRRAIPAWNSTGKPADGEAVTAS